MSRLKVALITGGSSGIGYAIAQRFLKADFQVVITGRDAEKLENAASELGEGCRGIQFDMNWMDRIPAFTDQLFDTFGRIDTLVNNAGINLKKPLTDVTDEEFEHITKTNQTALFALSREMVRMWKKNKSGGTIINISSMTAHYGIPDVVPYSASKTALEGMTRAMAVELAPHGIRVNCVAPGFIKTAMSAKALNSDPLRKNRVISRTPMRRLGEPAEVANAVFFLASSDASFITGETLKVDGGNAIGF
jgi:NAD(P)-dependent dehydrogenase (short-subunit alcohol dehydrogenase family)